MAANAFVVTGDGLVQRADNWRDRKKQDHCAASRWRDRRRIRRSVSGRLSDGECVSKRSFTYFSVDLSAETHAGWAWQESLPTTRE